MTELGDASLGVPAPPPSQRSSLMSCLQGDRTLAFWSLLSFPFRARARRVDLISCPPHSPPSPSEVAVGFPMIMGSASGFMTAGVVKGDWYKVRSRPSYFSTFLLTSRAHDVSSASSIRSPVPQDAQVQPAPASFRHCLADPLCLHGLRLAPRRQVARLGLVSGKEVIPLLGDG